jgi:tetratricopeptide (TPR) repeat protein
MKKSVLILMTIPLLVACSQTQQVSLPPAVTTGLQYLDNYQFTAADSVFDAITGQTNDSGWAEYGHGLVEERRLQYYNALNTYMTIVDRDPRFAHAHAGIARAFTGLGQPLRAVEAAENYAALTGPSAEAAYLLARAYIGSHQFDYVPETARRAIQAGFDEPIVKLVEARAVFLGGDSDAAREAFESAFSGGDETIEFLVEAADCLEAFGLVDSAMVLSRKAYDIGDGNSQVLSEHLLRAYRTHYMYEARRVLDELKRKDDQAMLATLMEMLFHQTNEDLLGAVNAVMSYRKIGGLTISPAVRELQCKLVAKDMINSLLLLEEVEVIVNRFDHSPRFKEFVEEQLMWGYVEIAMQANAAQRFEDFSAERLGLSRYQLARATIMAMFGVNDQYREAVDILLDEHEDDPDWLTRIADISKKTMVGSQDDAERLYRNALEVSPGFMPAFEGLVALLERNNRYADAYTAFETYSEIAERSPKLLIQRGVMAARTGRVDEGTKLFVDNIVSLKADLTLYEEMLQALERKHALGQINEVLERLVELNSGNPDALVRAAEWKSDLKDFDEALDLVRQVEEIEPDHFSAQVQKARAIYGQGDKERAFACFDSLYSVNEVFPELLLYYSQTLATEKRDFANAGNLARGALVTGRNMLKAWFNLCYLYIQEGRFREAAGKARQATQMYPNDPVGHYYLGKGIYLAEQEDSRGHLQKAIELGIYGEYL